jgi:hypothetical protein
MGIKAAIRSILLAEPSISGAVGARVSPRISKTGDILPRIAYNINGQDLSYHLTGLGSWQLDRFNLSIYAATSDQADEISEYIKDAFHAVADESTNGVIIRRLMMQAISEAHQMDSSEKPVYELTQSWEVSYFG